MGGARWRGFAADERRAVADALRWRASQLRTLLALADAMAGAPPDPGEPGGEDEVAETARARTSLDLLERLLAELPPG